VATDVNSAEVDANVRVGTQLVHDAPQRLPEVRAHHRAPHRTLEPDGDREVAERLAVAGTRPARVHQFVDKDAEDLSESSMNGEIAIWALRSAVTAADQHWPRTRAPPPNAKEHEQRTLGSSAPTSPKSGRSFATPACSHSSRSS
jgi:hypothetical protein